MTAVTELPPFVVAQDLIKRNEGKQKAHRAAEVEAWEQQKRHGGKDAPSGPFWAAVAFAVDDDYRKLQRGDEVE